MKAFQQTFQRIPLGGVSYEMLLNQNKVPAIYEVCPIRFNYQRLDRQSPVSVKTDAYPFESPNHDRGYVLDLIVRLKKEEVEVIVRYSKNLHKLSTIKNLISGWMKKTQSCIKSEDKKKPSDETI